MAAPGQTAFHRAADREAPAVDLRDAVVPEDAARVEQLVRLTQFFNPEEVAIARELVEEHLARGRASGYWFVMAQAPAQFSAYACFGPVPATQSSFHLYWIATHPDWQGRGLGSRLLAAVEAAVAAAGGERLYAETSSRPQYVPTHRFYTRNGFRLVADLPEYFAAGDGKLIYEKRIRQPGLPRGA